jgi:hypothetical protein
MRIPAGVPESYGSQRVIQLPVVTKAARSLKGSALYPSRSEALPQVTSLSELLSGYEASAFFGIAARKATPVAIVNKLNKAVNASLVDPKIV